MEFPQERSRRLRVLLIAESCNPEWASVPLVGWSHGRAIADRTAAHLVTHVRNRANILAAGLREGVDFTALEIPNIERPLERLAHLLHAPYGSNKAWTMHTALGAAAYAFFERRVWRHFREALLAGEFDLVHRLTPLSPVIPSPIAHWCRRAGVPFVLGPINGGLPWPRGFLHARLAEHEWLGFARGAARLMPGYASTRAHSSAILVGSRHAWTEIPQRYRHKTFYVPENGIEPAQFADTAPLAPTLPLRVAFAGRLVPIKGVDMLIEAAAPMARARQLTLTVIGDGPHRTALEALTRREQIAHAVRFFGWVPQRDIGNLLSGCQVFGFPSIHDFGGAAVLEAMALGLVPLVVDYGGPAELVSRRTGFAVPIGSRRQIVAELGAALEQIVRDPSVLPDIGRRARARAISRFAWQVKADQMVQIYDFVAGRGPRPSFTMPVPDSESAAAVESSAPSHDRARD